MIKVNENVDVSKQVLTIDIQSPVFSSMLGDLNGEIQRVIEKVFEKEFISGEITVKLNLEIPEAFKEFAREDDDGQLINECYKYRRPEFQHKVTSVLKKKYEQKGEFSGEREVMLVNGEYVASPLKQEQMCIEDYK